jgi:TolA-binding protein
LIPLIKKLKKVNPVAGPSPGMFLAMCLFLILATGCNINPTPPTPDISGSIEGNVYEPTSPITQSMMLLSGALVSVSSTSHTALTNISGYFRIDEIPVGEKKVTISKEGYVTITLENVPIIEGEITLLGGEGQGILILYPTAGKTQFDKAMSYYNDQDYVNAIIEFEKVLNDYSDSIYADDAQYYLALSYKHLHYYNRAILEFENLLSAYTYSAFADDAQFNIGDCYYIVGNYDQALIEYQKVIDNYPDSDLADNTQYSISHTYFKLDLYSPAISSFQKVIINYPFSEFADDAQFYIGYCYTKLEDFVEAIIELEKVIENYPQGQGTWPDGRSVPGVAQFYIGWCYEKFEDWINAIKAYQKVIDNYPGSTWSDGSLISENAQARFDFINLYYL